MDKTRAILSKIASESKPSKWTSWTLPSNPRIHIFDETPHRSSTRKPDSWMLHLLPYAPPNPNLAIGTTDHLPPTPQSFQANHMFELMLSATLAKYGHTDPGLIAQARANQGRPTGFIHLSDSRRPPDFGRIADPQDILGSVEVNRNGEICGRMIETGTYRIMTNDGILGLSDYIMDILYDRLQAEDNRQRSLFINKASTIKGRL